MMWYIAVRQRSIHDVLRIDLQHPYSLPRASMLCLDAKFGDETVDAVRQVPRHHNKGVVIGVSRQVGHQARSCRKRAQGHPFTHFPG